MPSIKKKRDPALQMRQVIESCKSLLATLLVLAVFIVHPLIISADTYYNITATKLTTYAVIVIMALVTFLLITLLATLYIPGYLKLQPRALLRSIRPYEAALGAYWLIMVVSTLLADSPIGALLGSSGRNEGLLMMTAYLILVIGIGRLYRPRERDVMILCAAAALVSAYGILQYYGVDPLHLNVPGQEDVQGPALIYVSTMSNRNVLSTYLCLAYGLSAVLFTRGQGLRRWAYFAMGLIIFYMMILGRTESGYVGVLVALVLLVPFLVQGAREASALMLFGGASIFAICFSVQVHNVQWPASYWASLAPTLLIAAIALVTGAALCWLLARRRKAPGMPIGKKALIWYGLCLLLLVGVILLILRLAAVTDDKALRAANEMLRGNFDDSLGSNRVFVWRRLLTMVPERPLFGHGPDQFFINFTQRYGKEAQALHGVVYDKAHSEYLQVLFDNGFLGLTALVGFYMLMMRRALKRMEQPMVAALTLALSIFLVQAAFTFSSPFAHPVVWALWGVLGAALYPKGERNA